MLNNNSKIHIVGGTGAMGTWLRKFFESLGFTVSVSDEKIKSPEPEKSDLVFISVPIDIAPEIILNTAKKIKKESLLVDLSSVNQERLRFLKKADTHR